MRKKTSKYSNFYFHLKHRRAKSLKVDSEAAEPLDPWRMSSLVVIHYESGGISALQAAHFAPGANKTWLGS